MGGASFNKSEFVLRKITILSHIISQSFADQ